MQLIINITVACISVNCSWLYKCSMCMVLQPWEVSRMYGDECHIYHCALVLQYCMTRLYCEPPGAILTIYRTFEKPELETILFSCSWILCNSKPNIAPSAGYDVILKPSTFWVGLVVLMFSDIIIHYINTNLSNYLLTGSRWFILHCGQINLNICSFNCLAAER